MQNIVYDEEFSPDVDKIYRSSVVHVLHAI